MRLMLARPCAMLLTLVAAPATLQAQTVLFRETFDSVATPQDNGSGVPVGQFAEGAVGSTGWTFEVDNPNQSDVRFGYNYFDDPGTSFDLAIPEAPNSQPGDAPNQGVALRTNVSAGTVDQAALYYEDASFTGQYQVQVDMYLLWAADSEQIGTTEHGGLFIGNATAENPGDPEFPGAVGAGAIFSSDGDTVNFDHALRKNNIYPSTESGQYSVNDFGFGPQLGYDNSDVNTNPANGDLIDLPALLPEIDLGGGITQSSGVVGYRWVTIKADVDTEALGSGTGTVPGLTTFSVEIAETGESYTLGTIDNSVIDDVNDGFLTGQDEDTQQGPVDMSGRVTLTLIDFFTSVASDINLASVVFDNLIVTQIDDTGVFGDFEPDGDVDIIDFGVFADAFGSVTGDAEYNAAADSEPDGDVDIIDFGLFADNFGTGVPATAVPEPSAALLAGLTAGALAIRRRR